MKKQLEISLNKAREIYTKGDETMNALLLETFSKEELEKKEINSWKDLGRIEGYYVERSSDITSLNDVYTVPQNKNIWATEEQAKASLAMSQLSQLMKHYNGDWTPDWVKQNKKYSIYIEGEEVRVERSQGNTHFLAFPTEEIIDTFLKKHRDLIEQAKPLLYINTINILKMKLILFQLLTNFTIGSIVFFDRNAYRIVDVTMIHPFMSTKSSLFKSTIKRPIYFIVTMVNPYGGG